MKKIILAVLMAVMIATPCFAQEVEPEGLFSLEGTLWQALPTGIQILPFPGIWDANGLQFVFYGDTGPSYIDMLAFSIFWEVRGRGSSSGLIRWYFGILQPIGKGMVFELFELGYPYLSIFMNVGFLIKINDNWVPPEFVSISPNKGEQGAILKDVTIRGLNTYFASGAISVMFIPAQYGEIISNIRPISDTEIKFDLELEADAPIGLRECVVTWDGGFGTGVGQVRASDVFEVLPKTN
jgi:hypothetical protein